MSGATDPLAHGWWLASRSAGIVALVAVTVSVLVGLGMSTKLLRRKGITPLLAPLHEHTAIVGLVATAVHGITLLGDPWLRPTLTDIALPFAIDYRPVFVAAGIVAGWLGAALGLSFYARKRLGAKRWRRAHQFAGLVYALALVHTVGAGTDAASDAARLVLVGSGAAIVFLLAVRALPQRATT